MGDAIRRNRGRQGNRRSTVRAIAFRLTAALLGVAGALVAGEVGFRLFGIVPPPPPPADQVDALRVRNDINRLGLREPEGFPPPRRANEVRIACLGDSMTYGEGVEAEQAYPRVMQRILEARGGRTWTVVNMGWLGDDPARERARYERLADVVQPDVLVLMMYVNDFAGAGAAVEDLLHRIYGIRDDRFALSQFSQMFHYVERKVRLRLAYERTLDYYRADAEAGVAASDFDPVMAEVRMLRDAAERRGTRFALVMMPWLVRLHDYPLRSMHGQVRAFAESHHIPFLDLLDVFAGRDDAPLRVSLANHHPAVAAHELMAGRIVAFLTDLGWAPR